MPIQVTCPGCLKRFQVNDKFAGKTGPCPNCSKPIKIPDKSEEVVIHAPDEGPKDAKGRPVFKPIRREEVKLTAPMIISIVAIAVISIGASILIRLSSTNPPTAILALGSIFMAPPLVLAGYWFLRDDELAGYQGKELVARCAIVSLLFAVTWAAYAYLPMYLSGYKSMAEIEVMYLLVMLPVMIGIGTAASILGFELEAGQGFMHYMLYFGITLVLALIMGAQIAEPFARNPSPASNLPGSAPASPSTTPPANTQPAAKTPVTPTAPPASDKASANPNTKPPATEEKKTPRLLQ